MSNTLTQKDIAEFKEYILLDCQNYFRKVARVFGHLHLDFQDKAPGISYDTLEDIFFEVLHDLIKDGKIIPHGTISPDNMRFSEIGQPGAQF